MASNNRLVIEGLDELRQALRSLPARLREEAGRIVVKRAESAKQQAVATYEAHARTGNLARGVTITHDYSQYGQVAIVRSRAKHAWMFENGTQARHTGLGANRGAMPPAHAFIPAMVRERRAMNDELIEIVRREGLQVSRAG